MLTSLIYNWLILVIIPLPQTAENYFYVPDLGQVPEIDVPSYLPDLPGIADDVSYSADLGPGFAPSGLTQNIPELPSIPDESSAAGTLDFHFHAPLCHVFFFLFFS